MSLKDKLWVLYCVQQSGKFGLGKASRILEPLSENEETALVQLESWANDKKEVLIEWSSKDGTNDKDNARILGVDYNPESLKEEYGRIMRNLQKKKTENQTPKAPAVKRSFIRKLTMEDERSVSPDMFAASTQKDDSSDSSIDESHQLPAKKAKAHDVQSSDAMLLNKENSNQKKGNQEASTSKDDGNGLLLEEIRKRDESIKVLEEKIASKAPFDGENMKALISSAVQSALSAGLLTNPGPGSSSSSEQPIGASKKVMLVKGYPLRIDQGALKIAVSIGSSGQTTNYLNGMINKIMEGAYSRKYMSEHSVSGRKPPTKRIEGSPEISPKPALPEKDVKAIWLFAMAGWKQWFGDKCTGPEEKLVRQAIRGKLSTESRGYTKALAAHPAIPDSVVEQITLSAPNVRTSEENSDDESD